MQVHGVMKMWRTKVYPSQEYIFWDGLEPKGQCDGFSYDKPSGDKWDFYEWHLLPSVQAATSDSNSCWQGCRLPPVRHVAIHTAPIAGGVATVRDSKNRSIHLLSHKCLQKPWWRNNAQ